jgi:hypothetical protein
MPPPTSAALGCKRVKRFLTDNATIRDQVLRFAITAAEGCQADAKRPPFAPTD